MAPAITNYLRVRNAKNLVATLGTNSYAFVGKPTEWSTGDETPPTPNNSVKEYYDAFDLMMSLKSIDGTNVVHGIVKNVWGSGSVFDMYRHDYSPSNRATGGAQNLYDASWVVINQNNNIYACLDNNGGAQSIVEPLSLTDEPFYTSDGYQWLRLYNLSSGDISDTSTDSFIPVAPSGDSDIVETVDGALYTLSIDVPGANITTSPIGASNQLPYYFCNILGDGTGAVARVTVAQGSVTSIEVVRNGSGYTYGTLDFVSQRCYASLNDLDAEINGLNPEGDGTFRSTVIIPPVGGFGTDLVQELGATLVMVFVSLDSNETDFDSGVTYRQVGILNNIAGTNNATTLNALYAVSVTPYPLDSTVFVSGETIRQTIVIDEVEHTAIGMLVHWDSTNGILSYVQDPDLHKDTDGVVYAFQGGKDITGTTSTKKVTPTETTASIDNRQFTDGYSNPEFTQYTGELLYLSNISPVLRTETQTEKLTMVIRY